MTTGLPLFAAIAAGTTTTTTTTTSSALQLSPQNGVVRRRRTAISPRGGNDRSCKHPALDVLCALPSLSEEDDDASKTTTSLIIPPPIRAFHSFAREEVGSASSEKEADAEVASTDSIPSKPIAPSSPPPLLKSLWSGLNQEFPSSEALLYLNAVAVLWGTQHPVIKLVVDDCDPSAFSFVRFLLGALVATPGAALAVRRQSSVCGSRVNGASPSKTVINNNNNNSKSSTYLRWGIELGFWMFLGYAFQAVGLETTTAQRSGFLLYLNVKFVPFFAFLLVGRHISIPTWISAFTALVGTGLLALSSDGESGISLDWNVGDLWSIAAAAASAMFILRLESATRAVPSSSTLNAICLWTVATSSLLWTASGSLSNMTTVWNNILHTMSMHPYEILYLACVTTALANYIQTKAQKSVTAERASIIYAMDPVYGAIFANLILGETLTPLGIVGAGLITLAAATNAFLDFGQKKASSKISMEKTTNNNGVEGKTTSNDKDGI